MNTNDYIQYLTKEFISYLDHPKKRKPKIKKDSTFFFGVIPTSIKMLFQK